MTNNSLPFAKYTGHGNSFIVIDELNGPLVNEVHKADIAERLLDSGFGIGADNVIYLQRADVAVLQEIAAVQGYWDHVPADKLQGDSGANVVFRLFEPEGSEALICGNGMRCAMALIHRRYGRPTALILTEIPSPEPMVLRGQSKAPDGRRGASAKVELGRIRAVPAEFEPDKSLVGDDNPIQSLSLATLGRQIPNLDGAFSVHTGEPYIVLIQSGPVDHNWDSGDWFTELGLEINSRPHQFPKGMNVLACKRISPTGIRFRVFERLKNRETWASGSGAVAAVAVSRAVGYVSNAEVTEVWSVSRYSSKTGPILVYKDTGSIWWIEGVVGLVCEGTAIIGEEQWLTMEAGEEDAAITGSNDIPS
jgi:diaminopimelate epimerase